MVKSHKYNTRYKNNKNVENIILISSEKFPQKKSEKKLKKIDKKIKINNNPNNSDKSDDDYSDYNSDYNSDDENEISSEMEDFIVSDTEPIEYYYSNNDSDDNNDTDNNNDTDYSDDSDDSDDSYDSYDSNDRLSNNKINKYKYAKFLNKLFPSNYTSDRINQIKRRRLLSPKSSHKNFNHIICIDSSVIKDKNSDISDSETLNNLFSDDEICEAESSDSEISDIIEDKKISKINSKKKLSKKDKVLAKEEKLKKKQISKNYSEYKKIFNVDSNSESKYFKNVLSLDEQNNIINKLNIIKDLTTIKKPYLIYLAELDIPDMYKACAINKINLLSNMDENMGNSEYYKLKSWIDSFIKIPFNKYTNIPVHVSDGLERCNQFISESKHILDNCVFGLENAKMQILQLIGLWIVNPTSIGTSISLKGPMGVGKTTLIKDGISKILNRYFTLIPLGGANDISYFEGHGYTYEGSTYGKIIDIMIQAKQMNPIIYFDELDKVSDSPKGEEVIGLLTHLTDTTQNSCYHDKYFSEIDFDLSKVLYIFSYNDEHKINPILRDRMYNIELKGYNVEDKLSISNKYLLPRIRSNISFNENDIGFTDDIIKYIIQKYTENEEGVRNLKRCFEILYTKLNLLKLLKNDNEEIYKLINLSSKTILPLTLTTEIVDKLLYKKELSNVPFGMYT